MKRVARLALAAFAASFVGAIARADDLYLYWPLNEGTGASTATLGTAAAGSATVNNDLTGGLGGGGAAWITGDALRGTVISGNGNNGSSAFVTTQGVPSAVYNGDWTISGWVQLSGGGSGGNDVVLGNRFGGPGGNWAKLTPTNFEWRPSGGGNVNITDIPSDSTWRQFTITKSGNNFDAYINGSLNASASFAQTFPAGTVPFFIGGDSGGERPEGRYDDVGFFNAALSPGKINAITAAANNTNGLDLDLGELNELFKVFDGEIMSAEVDGMKFVAASLADLTDLGLVGPLGVPQTDGQVFAIMFDGALGGVVSTVPEPASIAVWTLLGAGLAGLGVWRNRRRA